MALGSHIGRSTPAAPAISRPIPSCPWGRTDRSTPALGSNRPFYPRSVAEPILLTSLWGRTGRSTPAAHAITRPIPSCPLGRRVGSTPGMLVTVNILANVWPMPGQCLANVWPMFGRCLANVWPMAGKCLANGQPMFGRCLANAWPMFRRCLANAWPMIGQWLANDWPMFGR